MRVEFALLKKGFNLNWLFNNKTKQGITLIRNLVLSSAQMLFSPL